VDELDAHVGNGIKWEVLAAALDSAAAGRAMME
jgi:hypothetical protein